MRSHLLLFYLLFSCSSVLVFAQVDHWESIVSAGDDWQYYVPDGEGPPANWQSLPYAADGWETGPGGMGYGDEDDQTIIPNTPSVYLRRIFELQALENLSQLAFQIDYDDAYVAYLNGVEIARSAGLNSPFGEPAWDELATEIAEPLLPYGQIPELRIIPTALWESLLTSGENVLALQVHNVVGSSDLSSNAWLHAGIIDSGMSYSAVPEWFEPPLNFTNSNLPIVLIDVDPGAIPDEPKINVNMRVINNVSSEGVERNYVSDTTYAYDGNIGIELRGSTSQLFFPKKSYAVETRKENGENRNVELLGLPKENDWIFYGPYSDKTMIRNALAMDLSRQMGNYASRVVFFELVMNEDYRGVYLLMEKVKRDSSRVDIAKLKSTDLEGDDLTGGYIFKVDKFTGSSTEAWLSPFSSVTGGQSFFQFHYPKSEKMELPQREYIMEAVNDFESSLKNDQFENDEYGYRDYINMDSFVDYMLMSEVSKNVDAYRLSTYLYKDKDSKNGKIHLGPIWDFNIAFGNANYCGGDDVSGFAYLFDETCPFDEFGVPFWWKKMMQDDLFIGKLKCRWEDLREGIFYDDSIASLIDDYELLLQESSERNFARWNILNEHIWPNVIESGSYEAELNYLRSFLMNRMAWLDVNLPGICMEETGIYESGIQSQSLYVYDGALKCKNEPSGVLQMFDSLGRIVAQGNWEEMKSAWSSLSSGIYLYRIQISGRVLSLGKLQK